MKKEWMVLVFATGMTVGMTMGAERTSAQGPAGVGATTASSSTSSSSSSHSYNPIKWIKKGSKKSDDSADANIDRDKKLAVNLQSQGVLPAGKDLKTTCEAFKELGDCVAALHASHNLGLDFNCVLTGVTGVHTGADVSACKGNIGEKPESLSKTIRALVPEADAKAEAKNAEKQAKDDLKEAGA